MATLGTRSGGTVTVPTSTRPKSSRPDQVTGRLPVGLAALICVVPIVAILSAYVQQHPGGSTYGDVAYTEVAVQNALHLRQVLGPYDRFGWNHPGPVLFYLLAVPYAVLHQRAVALDVGALLINVASAAGVVAIVKRRHGPTAASATIALFCAFAWWVGLRELSAAWTPIAIAWPMALVVVACADVAAGGTWTLVAALAVGSIVVQSEVGLAPVVGIAVVSSSVLRFTARRRQADRTEVTAALIAGVLMMVVIWELPLFQQLTNPHGNLGLLWQFFVGHHGHHGLAEATNALADGMLVKLGPSHIGIRPGPVAGYTGRLVALGAVTVLIAAWSAYRRQPTALALAVGALGLAAVYLVSLTRVEDRIGGYLLVWTRSLTLCIALAGILAATAPGRPPAKWTQKARVVGAVVIIVAVAVPAWRLTRAAGQLSRAPSYGFVGDAARRLSALIPAAKRPVLMCMSWEAGPGAAGIVANLRRSGWEVNVEERWILTFGEALHETGRERTAVFVDVTNRLSKLSVSPASTVRSGPWTMRVYFGDQASSAGPAPGATITSALCPLVYDPHPAPRYVAYLRTLGKLPLRTAPP